MHDRRVVFLGRQYSGRFSLMRRIAKYADRSVRRSELIPCDDGFHDLRRVIDCDFRGRTITLDTVSATIVDYRAYCRAFVPGASIVMVIPMREEGVDEEHLSATDSKLMGSLLRYLVDLGVDPFGPRVCWVYSQCDRPDGVSMVKGVAFDRLNVVRTSSVTGMGVDIVKDWILSTSPGEAR